MEMMYETGVNENNEGMLQVLNIIGYLLPRNI